MNGSAAGGAGEGRGGARPRPARRLHPWIVVVVAACQPAPEPAAEWVRGLGLEPVPAEAEAGFLRRPDDACLEQPLRAVVRSRKAWDALWRGRGDGCTPPALPDSVSFGAHALVVAGAGRRASGGTRIAVKGAGMRGDTLRLAVLTTEPGEGCETTDMVDHPFQVVRVPQSAAPVAFIERREAPPCPAGG